jgi:hypothetical protein
MPVYTARMSKILVLSADHSGARDVDAGVITRLVAAVVEGAEAVRFAEVDLRRLDATPPAAAAAYDALIICAAGATDPTLHDWIAASERSADTVVSVFTPAGDLDPLVAAVARLGLLVVPPEGVVTPDAARALGRRVTTVAGWVRHAKSHEPHHHPH